jgi:hypothetical protein
MYLFHHHIITLFIAIVLLLGCEKKPLPPTEKVFIQQTLVGATSMPYEAAKVHLEAALEQYPKNPELIESLAFLENKTEHFEAAADLFALLSTLSPDDEALYLRYAAEAYAHAHDYEKSATYYTYYLVHEPEDGSTWLNLAKTHAVIPDYPKALNAYQKAFELNDQNSLIADYITLALNAKEYILADTLLKKWETLSPHHPPIYAAYFDLYTAIDDHENALSKLIWLKQQAPDTLKDPQRSLAVEALEAWQQSILEKAALEERERLEAEKAAEQERRALVESQKKAAEDAQNNQPPSAEFYQKAADTAFEAQDYLAAQKLYWKSLCLDMTSASNWKALSQAALYNNDLEMAETAALEGQRRRPDDLLYTLNLLNILQKTATEATLLQALIKAQDQFPKSIELTYDLAHAYETLAHNPRNARLLYEEYLKMADKNHPHYNQAIQALKRLP